MADRQIADCYSGTLVSDGIMSCKELIERSPGPLLV